MTIAYWDLSEGATAPAMLGALMAAGLDRKAWTAAMERLPWSGWRLEVDEVVGTGRTLGVTFLGGPPTIALGDLRRLTGDVLLPPAAKNLAHALDMLDGAVPERNLATPDALALVGVCVASTLLSIQRHWRTLLALNPNGVNETAGVLVGTEILIRTDRPTLTSLAGAALARSLAAVAPTPAPLRLHTVGTGVARPPRDTEDETHHAAPQVTVILGATVEQLPLERAFEACTTVDDMDPELIPPVVAALRDAGALDAWWSPAVTRGGRPGVTIHVLCVASNLDALCHMILRETTTIGVRVHEIVRYVLPRSQRVVVTEVGEVAIKESVMPDGTVRWKAELGDCLQLARARGVTVETVRALVRQAVEGGSRL